MNEKIVKVYFLGIGGISMSAVSIYLKNKGFIVGGCDKTFGESVSRLKSEGIYVDIISGEQITDGLKQADVVVYTSALSENDARLKFARESGKIVFSRAQLLTEIFKDYPFFIGVGGTHGKTACTCMLAHIFKCAGVPVFAHLGGFDKSLGNCFYSGQSCSISEICEYKRNVALFSPTIGIVLNVDNDHLESYGNFSGVCAEFLRFAKRSKTCVYNADDVSLGSICGVSFSLKNPSCDYYVYDVGVKNGFLRFKVNERGKYSGVFKIKSELAHNAGNAVAAIASARLYGIGFDKIKQGLCEYGGVKRREEWLGEYNGALIFADYCHHPAQIKAVLNALLKKGKKLTVVFQPHTYSRTKNLFEQFALVLNCESDKNAVAKTNENANKKVRVVITETYAAREEYDYYGSGERLASAIEGCEYIADKAEAVASALRNAGDGEIVAFLGAGDVYDELIKQKARL